MLPVAHPPTKGYRTIRGSAIHVMLALRRSSRQVVVADEEPDCSVVLFRSDFVLFSKKNHVKALKNQWAWAMP